MGLEPLNIRYKQVVKPWSGRSRRLSPTDERLTTNVRRRSMTERIPIRAVLDTNVPIAAHLSRNPRSPTVELIERWRAGEFVQLYSDDTLAEFLEKFLARRVHPESVAHDVADLLRLGEHVDVADHWVSRPIVTADPDDDMVLACALAASATCIVTYDPHFDVLGGDYESIPILDGSHISSTWCEATPAQSKNQKIGA